MSNQSNPSPENQGTLADQNLSVRKHATPLPQNQGSIKRTKAYRRKQTSEPHYDSSPHQKLLALSTVFSMVAQDRIMRNFHPDLVEIFHDGAEVAVAGAFGWGLSAVFKGGGLTNPKHYGAAALFACSWAVYDTFEQHQTKEKLIEHQQKAAQRTPTQSSVSSLPNEVALNGGPIYMIYP